MRTINQGGDVLARGGVRATFQPPQATQEKFDAAFGEFDLDRFLGREKRSGDAGSTPTGNASLESGKSRKSRTKKPTR